MKQGKITGILFFLLANFLLATTAFALNPNSAYRAPNQDWREVMSKQRLKQAVGAEDTIVNAAISWNNDNIDKQQKLLNDVPVWPDYQTIKDQFQFLKTNRFLLDPTDNSLKRTIPWRYPLDYCFERAAASVILYDTGMLPRPGKVFAFGNLRLLSPYGPAPDNILSFWYHVAPVVRDKQTNLVYVLDPSLNYEAPLPLENWLKQVVELSHDRELRVNICNGHGSVPFDVCSEASPLSEEQLAADVVNRLPPEWEHLQSKGINAQHLLTDEEQELTGQIIYGAIALDGLQTSSKLKSSLLVQYKLATESVWNNLLDVGQVIEKINQFDYFMKRSIVPIGSIFAKSNRAANCQCSYYACRCALPAGVNKVDLRVMLNGHPLKQCTYQYPNDKNLINHSFIGPDIHYQFHVTPAGDIDPSQIAGSIDGCKE